MNLHVSLPLQHSLPLKALSPPPFSILSDYEPGFFKSQCRALSVKNICLTSAWNLCTTHGVSSRKMMYSLIFVTNNTPDE